MSDTAVPNAPVILITGATDGIGLALAKHYHRQGRQLVLVGRRPAAHFDDPIFKEQLYCQVDLAAPEAASIVGTFFHEHQLQRLDVLVHNAGTGYAGPVETQPANSIAQVLAVNLQAPVALTQALLPFVTQARGKIVFISSIVAELPVPDYAVYGASKAALNGFARSLRVELAPTMSVQVIHPGAVRTGMHAKVGLSPEKINVDRWPSAEQVAAQIAAAIAGSRRDVTLGLTNTLARLAGMYAGNLIEALLRWNARR